MLKNGVKTSSAQAASQRPLANGAQSLRSLVDGLHRLDCESGVFHEGCQILGGEGMKVFRWFPPGPEESHTHFDPFPQPHAMVCERHDNESAAFSDDSVAFLKGSTGAFDDDDF